jgi:tetratricopeptide (TPR) repeat protein
LEKFPREENPQLWGTLQMNLGGLWAQREDGARTDNLNRATRALESALEVFPPETFPVQHAEVLLDLSQVHDSLNVGSKRAHTETALEQARQALASLSKEKAPREWAKAMILVGNALRERRGDNRQKNLEEAVVAFNNALEMLSQTSDPQSWSMAKSSLANTLAELAEYVTDDPVQSLERSIAHQQEAIEVLNPITVPEEWANAHRNLAISFGERVKGSRADNVERAIALLELGLVVLNRNDHPRLRSGLLETIGEQFESRSRGHRLENLYRSVEAYDAAWETRSRSQDPDAWLRLRQRRLKAKTVLYRDYKNMPSESLPDDLNNRLSKWASTITTADPQEFLAAEQDAASAVSAEDYPRTWTIAQEDFAKAQMGNPFTDGDSLEESIAAHIANVRESIKTYEAVLVENPKEIRPRLWARTRGQMATAYELLHMLEDLLHRGQGGLADRAKVELPNRSDEAMRCLKLAAEALQDMLLVYTVEADPTEYLKNASQTGFVPRWTARLGSSRNSFCIGRTGSRSFVGGCGKLRERSARHAANARRSLNQRSFC